MPDPAPDDLAAVIGEGDLVEYLLSTAGRSRKRPKEADGQPTADEMAAARKPITSPLHRIGAWPSGTRTAGPNTCSPDCDCAIWKAP